MNINKIAEAINSEKYEYCFEDRFATFYQATETLDENFIWHNIKKLITSGSLETILEKQLLSEDLLIFIHDTLQNNDELFEFKENIYVYITCYQKLSKKLFQKTKDNLDWRHISNNDFISLNFIKKYSNKINFESLSYWNAAKFSLKFIEDNKDKIAWSHFNYREFFRKHQNIFLKFVRKYKNYIDWNNSSWDTEIYHHILYSNISLEKFIEEFKDKINFNIIFRLEKVSRSCLLKYVHQVNTEDGWKYLFYDQGIDKDFFDKYCPDGLKDKVSFHF